MVVVPLTLPGSPAQRPERMAAAVQALDGEAERVGTHRTPKTRASSRSARLCMPGYAPRSARGIDPEASGTRSAPGWLAVSVLAGCSQDPGTACVWCASSHISADIVVHHIDRPLLGNADRTAARAKRVAHSAAVTIQDWLHMRFVLPRTGGFFRRDGSDGIAKVPPCLCRQTAAMWPCSVSLRCSAASCDTRSQDDHRDPDYRTRKVPPVSCATLKRKLAMWPSK